MTSPAAIGASGDMQEGEAVRPDARYWIEKLQLREHPEGGFFRESYRSRDLLNADQLPARYGGGRSASTAIYFLLTGGQFSAFHRLKSDEIWHFYEGSPLTVYIIDDEGTLSAMRLGRNLEQSESFQVSIPAGCWLAAAPDESTSCSLVGCTVSPGFEYADFELADRETLARAYPAHRAIIERLTR